MSTPSVQVETRGAVALLTLNRPDSANTLNLEVAMDLFAAVNGTAAGAGVGLVTMADLAVCGASSRFKLAYSGVGLTPDGGTSFLLPRTIGIKRTMELVLLDRALASAEAL